MKKYKSLQKTSGLFITALLSLILGSVAIGAAPSEPQALSAFDSTDLIRVSWSTPNTGPVTSYRVYRSQSSNDPNPTQIGSGGCSNLVNVLSCDDNNITANTTYYYKAKAFNGNDGSGFSNEASAKLCSAPSNEKPEARITRKILEVFTGCGNSSKIFLWAIGIGAILAFGVITYSGVIWSLSGISEEKSHAKDYIFGAIQGLVLLIVAYVILYIINPGLVTF